MRFAPIFPAVLALMAAGCVETKNVPYLPGDLVFEPALLGNWVEDTSHVPPFPGGKGEKEAENVIRVETGPGTSYRRIRDVGGQKQTDTFHVFKLGDRYFTAETGDGTYVVARATISGNSIKLWDLDVRAMLGDNPGEANHEAESGLLLGPTAEVRTFLSRRADDPGVWGSVPRVYRRKDGLKVDQTGLTGRKQRTLDYWSEMRTTLQGVRLEVGGTGASSAAAWGQASKSAGAISAEGVDPDAAACGPLVTALCDTLANYARGNRRPADPLGARVRASLGAAATDPANLPPGREVVSERVRETSAKLDAARKLLSERYGCEFTAIR